RRQETENLNTRLLATEDALTQTNNMVASLRQEIEFLKSLAMSTTVKNPPIIQEPTQEVEMQEEPAEGEPENDPPAPEPVQQPQPSPEGQGGPAPTERTGGGGGGSGGGNRGGGNQGGGDPDPGGSDGSDDDGADGDDEGRGRSSKGKGKAERYSRSNSKPREGLAEQLLQSLVDKLSSIGQHQPTQAFKTTADGKIVTLAQDLGNKP